MNDTPQPPETVAPPKPIFDRMPGETVKAFAAFRRYLALGPDRGVRKLGKKNSRAMFGLWSSKWNWVERAAAYDEYMTQQEQKAMEAEQRQRAKVWADRRDAHRERRFQLGELMLNKAARILKGRGKVTQHTAARLAEVGDKLIGLSADLPTSNMNIGANEEAAPAAILAPAGTVNIYLPEKEKLPDETKAA